MSYTIIYNKAFIKIQDKYIPIIQYGDNNCYDISNRGKDIPAKNWDVWNYTIDGRMKDTILFNRDEITEIATSFGTPNSYGEYLHRTRNTCFKSFMEGMRWFDNGVKYAKTIEEYEKDGNTIYFRVTDFKKPYGETLVFNCFINSESQLLELLEQYKSDKKNDYYVSIGFQDRELYKPRKRRAFKEKKRVESSYAIKIDSEYYFVSKKKYGYKYSPYSSASKYFKSMADAQRYINNNLTWLRGNLSIELVQGGWFV